MNQLSSRAVRNSYATEKGTQVREIPLIAPFPVIGFFKAETTLGLLRLFTNVFDINFNGRPFFNWLFAGHNDF
jgi:hypothetical protein